MQPERKSIYLKWINDNVPRILAFQDMRKKSETYGCFFYPGWRDGAGYYNARWQEAVLSLAWAYKRKADSRLLERIKAGIDFWCKIQNNDGSFSEYFRGEHSFSATAFSTFAVAEAARTTGVDDEWESSLKKAGYWLSRNNENLIINQQTSAMLSLLKLHHITHTTFFMKESEKKMNSVFRAQSPDGWFTEKNGMDLSYSSLTVELLGLCKKELDNSLISEAAGKYFRLLHEFVFRDGTFGGMYNSRTRGWVVLDSLELFPDIRVTNDILYRIFECYKKGRGNIQHLPDDRHVCTDLYRLCFAHDNASSELKRPAPEKSGEVRFENSHLLIKREKKYTAITDSSLSNLYSLWASGGIRIFTDRLEKQKTRTDMLRLLSTLKMQKLKNLAYVMPRPRKTPNKKIILDENSIEIYPKSKDSLFVACNKKCEIKKEGRETLMISDMLGGLRIAATGAGIDATKHGEVPIPDSIFFGDKSLSFIRVSFSPVSKSYKYSILFD